jgi:hypothetical protein
VSVLEPPPPPGESLAGGVSVELVTRPLLHRFQRIHEAQQLN